jgi:alpha-galactosidase
MAEEPESLLNLFQNGVINFIIADNQKQEHISLSNTIDTQYIRIFPTTEIFDDGILITLNLKPKEQILIENLSLHFSIPISPLDKILVNGYQSWSTSKKYTVKQKRQTYPSWAKRWVKKFALKNFGDHSFFVYPKNTGHFFSHTFTFIDQKATQNGYFFGSLDEASAYTFFEVNAGKQSINIIKDCSNVFFNQEKTLFKIFISKGHEKDVFSKYFSLMKISALKIKKATGWTSWYNWYVDITENIILDNIKTFHQFSIPIDYYQIDDGWQHAVGDWLDTNEKFPNGMKYLADQIHEAGYKAGLWLAPFVAEESSYLLKDHPDWILRDNYGKMVIAGNNPFLWSGYFYSLDIEHPEVKTYLKDVFDTILDKWGYDLVKLDFLYAVAIISRKNRTRGEIMAEGMDLLRELTGDKLIIGCGVPIGASLGKVDFCRVSCDVGLTWENISQKLIRHQERVSTINAIETTIGRHVLNELAFVNDPDVFFLRSENIKMNKNQRITLYLINLVFGGLVFTSDDISTYSKEEMRLYLQHFPHKQKNIILVKQDKQILEVSFSIGDKNYMLFSNFGKKTRKILPNKGLVYCFNQGFLDSDNKIELGAYESLSMYIPKNEDFCILGTDMHVFPGSEIDELIVDEENLSVKVHKDVRLSGHVYIKLPDDKKQYLYNGKPIKRTKSNNLRIGEIKIYY